MPAPRQRDVDALVEHLFRHRAGQMVSALTRLFGPAHLDLAEDVVQEALSKALRQWPFRCVPDQPAAWLFQVARNAALDMLRPQIVPADTRTRYRLPDRSPALTRDRDPVRA